MESPDRWIILSAPGVPDKVLMGWYGGYLGADSWRLNSGIIHVDDEGDAFVFTGYSGSKYRCFKTRYGATGMMAAKLDDWKDCLTVQHTYPYNTQEAPC